MMPLRPGAPPPAAPEPEAPFDGTAWARQFAAFDPPAAPEPSEPVVTVEMVRAAEEAHDKVREERAGYGFCRFAVPDMIRAALRAAAAARKA